MLVCVLVCATCLRLTRESISQETRSEVTLKIHLTSKMCFPCTTHMNVVCMCVSVCVYTYEMELYSQFSTAVLRTV